MVKLHTQLLLKNLILVSLYLSTEAFLFDPKDILRKRHMTVTKRRAGQNSNSLHKKSSSSSSITNHQHKRFLSTLNLIPPTTSFLSPSSLFTNTPLFSSIQLCTFCNLVGLGISLLTGSHLHLDLLGTGAFAVAALPTFLTTNILRVKVSSAAVILWGVKLATFLFVRALKVKHDGRLDDTLSTVGGTCGFWFISTLWGILCSLPHTLGTTSSSPGNIYTLTIGSAIYTLGLLTESLADYQKWMFKTTNPGEFCNIGLWSISQHPNFFGNLMLWSGIFVMNIDSLIEPMTASSYDDSPFKYILSMIWNSRRVFVALLSPLFMSTLFYGQASGTITNSVELANAKYGHLPAYASYIKSVPLIVPKNIIKWLREVLTLGILTSTDKMKNG